MIIAQKRANLVGWTTEHWYTMIPASALQIDIVLEQSQTMPLRYITHRFFHLQKMQGKKTKNKIKIVVFDVPR